MMDKENTLNNSDKKENIKKSKQEQKSIDKKETQPQPKDNSGKTKKEKKVNIENINENSTPDTTINTGGDKGKSKNPKKKDDVTASDKIDKEYHNKSSGTKDVNPSVNVNSLTKSTKESTKPKKRIFALISFEEIKNEEKEKKKAESSRQSRIENFGLFAGKISETKEITSKQIIKMLLKEDITTINEEILVILLKLSKAGLSKQGMVCKEFINAIKIFIKSVDSDPARFKEELRDKINKIVEIVNKLTYKIGGLENSCSYIKKVIQKIIPMNRTVVDLKEALIIKLDEFINTKINTKDIISNKHGINLIKEGDCLLIYGKSQIYRTILSKAVEKGINFKVIYVDNRQNNHIKSEIEFLSKLGVNVTYSYVNGISGIIEKVSKVFIKAKSMLSNGNLLGEVGTSVISCIAYNFKKPVIAFSETYKFWDKILMNSFQTNNIQIDKFIESSENYNRLKMYYDITPANYINMVVCEHGYIPPTSVPVVIREFGQEEVEFE